MIEAKGRIIDFSKGNRFRKPQATFEFDSFDAEGLEGDLRIKVKPWKESRSDRANKFMWACIGEIAQKVRADKWDIYLTMLKRYGKFTYICVRPEAVEALKKQWRECEVLNEIDINGDKAIQVLCYYGSHLYDTEEMAALIDGIITEMKNLQIPVPLDEKMRALCKAY